MEQLFITTVVLRLCKWVIRRAFRILLWVLVIGFCAWLMLTKLGYGEIFEEAVGYVTEFFGFLGSFLKE